MVKIFTKRLLSLLKHGSILFPKFKVDARQIKVDALIIFPQQNYMRDRRSGEVQSGGDGG